MIERSDVWCTNCESRFIAELDLSLNGNHEITCPLCRHVHYRVVRDGVVTEDRWRSSAGWTYQATTMSYATMTVSTNTTSFSTQWFNTTDLTTGRW